MIRAMYRRTGDVFTAGNGEVRGIFNVADRTAFDAVVGDYTLRYLATDADLAPESVVTVEGVAYVVMTHPERINAHEMVVQLMRES